MPITKSQKMKERCQRPNCSYWHPDDRIRLVHMAIIHPEYFALWYGLMEMLGAWDEEEEVAVD